MKVYFIFDIKKEFVSLYKDNQRVLYNILKQIYYLDKEEVSYGYSLFKQLIKPINKSKIDRELFIKFHQDIPYSKRGNIHYINNLYRDEISRLEVKTSYIRLEVEKSYSSFFQILKKFSKNYFVCCFREQDFFFLSEEKSELLVNDKEYR